MYVRDPVRLIRGILHRDVQGVDVARRDAADLLTPKPRQYDAAQYGSVVSTLLARFFRRAGARECSPVRSAEWKNNAVGGEVDRRAL